MRIRPIFGRIPMVPINDPENYPVWSANAGPGESGANYPKMINHVFSQADLEAWLVKNARKDPVTKEISYELRAPTVGSLVAIEADQQLVDSGFAMKLGDLVIANNADEERKILALLGMGEDEDEAEAPAFEVPLTNEPSLAQRNLDLEAEVEKLRTQLAAKPKSKPKKGKAKTATRSVSTAKPKSKAAAAAIEAAKESTNVEG